jgi:hypothetical protein
LTECLNFSSAEPPPVETRSSTAIMDPMRNCDVGRAGCRGLSAFRIAAVCWIAAGPVPVVAASTDSGVVSFGRTVLDSRVFHDRWTKVSIGSGGHFVGRRHSGSVKCWGENSGVCYLPGPECTWTSGEGGQCIVPDGLGAVVDVAAGTQHSVAVTTDGLVRCWGFNSYGESTPPANLSSVIRVAAGARHSMALTASGAVRCWGDNSAGQSTVPAGVGAVAGIAANGFVSIACRASGTVAVWGQNATTFLAVPSGLSQVQSVACGYNHAVAVIAGGTIRCWGSNSLGQLDVPAQIGPVSAVAAGGSHTLALLFDGTVRAWGASSEGQITVPSGVSGAVSIGAGGNASCAILADGSLRIWGRYWGWPRDAPEVSQMSFGTDHWAALRADGSLAFGGRNDFGQCSPPADMGPLSFVQASIYCSVGIDLQGRPWGWGQNSNGQLSIPPNTGSLRSLAVAGHVVGARNDGTVICWGNNAQGQCNTPAGAIGVQAVSASTLGSLARKATGTLMYWGSATYGQQNFPVDLGPVAAAELGDFHVVALRTDGVVRCWGSNSYGQCSVPAGTQSCIDVSAGMRHSVALRADGTVICWGSEVNSAGECDPPNDLTRVSRLVRARSGLTAVILAPECRGDLSGDARVTGADIGILLGQWGASGGVTGADIDSNGVVSGSDLGLLLGDWGDCPE